MYWLISKAKLSVPPLHFLHIFQIFIQKVFTTLKVLKKGLKQRIETNVKSMPNFAIFYIFKFFRVYLISRTFQKDSRNLIPAKFNTFKVNCFLMNFMKNQRVISNGFTHKHCSSTIRITLVAFLLELWILFKITLYDTVIPYNSRKNALPE